MNAPPSTPVSRLADSSDTTTHDVLRPGASSPTQSTSYASELRVGSPSVGGPRLRVLMVFHAAPCLPALGPARRHYHMLRELARRHRICVASIGTPEDEQRFRADLADRCVDARFAAPIGSRLEKSVRKFAALVGGRSGVLGGRSAALQRAVDELVAAHDFDAVVLSSTLLGYLKLPSGVPVVGDTHNVEFDCVRRAAEHARALPARWYYTLEGRNTRREELAFSRRCVAIWATSSRDVRILREHLPRMVVEHVPNGVDLPATVSEPSSGSADIVFVGLMAYPPNADGVRWFLDAVLPLVRRDRPDARFTVVGARPPRWLLRLQSTHVRVVGFVPSVERFLGGAAVCVAPLRLGGGSRVKIVEAMAHGRAMVTTTIGCEGLDLEDGVHALIRDSATDFAEAVVSLLDDPARRRTIGAAARAEIERRFSWTDIGRHAAARLAAHVRA